MLDLLNQAAMNLIPRFCSFERLRALFARASTTAVRLRLLEKMPTHYLALMTVVRFPWWA
jgi:hypothetical protein